MDLQDIQFMFNRAVAHTFNLKKLILVATILMMCGLLVIFFRGLAINAGQWISLSLNFLPVFLCAGVLLAAGIILTRIYHDEVKKKTVSYRTVFNRSWETMISASYLSIPIILSYILLWMLLGIFFLLNEVPGIGKFFSALLAFGPFLLNLGSLVLCLLSLSLLYFIAPLVALRGVNKIQLSQILTKRLKENLFLNLVMALIAVTPFILLFSLLLAAAALTGSICEPCNDPLYTIIQGFIVMIPFTAMLSPAVIFFFNFATEAHVIQQKRAA